MQIFNTSMFMNIQSQISNELSLSLILLSDIDAALN